MGAARLLLVDFINRHTYSQVHGEALPFVQAWAKRAGLATRLVAVALSGDEGAVPGVPPEVDAADARRLVEAAAGFGASHVLANLPAPDALREELTRGGAAAVADLGDRFVAADEGLVPWLETWLGLPSGEGGLLPDLVAPDLAVEALGPGAAETVPAVRVVAGRYEWRPHAILRSPLFKPEKSVGNPLGRPDLAYPYRTAPVPLALAQLAAARVTLPAGRRTDESIILGADVLLALDDFAAAVAEREPTGAAFLFSVEADAVVAAADAIEAALPRLRDAGQRLAIANVGPYNFSRDECERLGARVLPETWAAADERLRGWEARFPDTFVCLRTGGYGVALWTPWTTLADLRANLVGGRTLDPRSHGYFTSTRARITPDTPAAERAAADGLLVERSDPAVFGAGADDVDRRHGPTLAWRFRDPRVARLHTLVVRMLPDEGRGDEDDPYLRAAQSLRGALDDATREDPLAVFGLMLDVVEAAPPDADIRALLEATLTHIGKPELYIGLEDEPEEEDEELRRPDDEVARDARRIAAHLDALPPEGRARLQGYEPDTVVDEHNTEGHRVIAVTLRAGPDPATEDRLMVNLLPRQSVRGSFALTTRYAICYHQDTPIDTREKELAVQALAELIEEATTASG